MNHSDTVLRLVSQNFYDDISWTIYLLFFINQFLNSAGDQIQSLVHST